MVKSIFKLNLGSESKRNRIQATWLGGRVVMQRIANPCTPVRFRPQPPTELELMLNEYCPGGGIGRHKGLKIPRRKLRAGSSPAPGTNYELWIILKKKLL